MIRILIADDHAIVRGGLKQLFAMVQDIDRLKNKEVAQDDRTLRLERTVEQNRAEVREQLTAIASDVKDTRKDIKDITLMLARPPRGELNKWEK